MTELSADIAIKVSSEAARRLIESYYPALEFNRNTISSFYMLPTAIPGGKPLPSITYNGNIIPSAADMQRMFQEQMPAAHYEVQSFDCQAINHNYIAANSEATISTAGKNMTILVIMSGYVKYGGSREAATRGFSESFILEPNHDAAKAKSQGKNFKNWVIQSQTFRMVV